MSWAKGARIAGTRKVVAARWLLRGGCGNAHDASDHVWGGCGMQLLRADYGGALAAWRPSMHISTCTRTSM